MAIKSKKKIDFEYEFESQNVSYTISLRFYHTDDYGPTIAVLDDSGEPVMNLPVAIFPEVSDFLTEQGIIESKKTLAIPSIPARLQKPLPSLSKPNTIPKQRLIATRTVINPLKIGNKNIENAVPVDLESEEEDQIDAPDDMKAALIAEKNRLEGIQSAIEDSVPAQSLSSTANQESLSDEEIEQMLNDRKKASTKQKSTESSIRRK